jgi:rSAM/selenodomain-associated transferase 2
MYGKSMDNRLKKSEMSIIVPVLNEAGIVRGFLDNLAEQRNVDFEVIICDGGSTDKTCVIAEEAAKSMFFPLKIIAGEMGRGRQMNRGAEEAQGDFLLFLHVDSLFDDVNALRKGIDALGAAMRISGNESVAGRFALRFRRRAGSFPLLYFFLESKARLNRVGCIHGDQGFLLLRSIFLAAGLFDESIPVLEDTRFADLLQCMGTWILLPSKISASARRFEMEGPVRREILNGIVMTLGATRREDFLREMPHVYKSQDRCGRLMLYPYFSRIRLLLGGLRLRERIAFWYACGAYAASNSWQPAFLLDVRRNYRWGLQPGEGSNICLDRFDKYAGSFIGKLPVRVVGCALVWTFFHLSLLCLFCGEKNA